MTDDVNARRARETAFGGILAIVGSTEGHFSDEQEAETKNYIRQFILKHHPYRIITGGATGADTWGFEIARELGIETVVFFPAHPRWEPNGYKERNQKIAEAATALLRIVHHKSTTYGSGWTRDEAGRIGKPTIERIVGLRP